MQSPQLVEDSVQKLSIKDVCVQLGAKGGTLGLQATEFAIPDVHKPPNRGVVMGEWTGKPSQLG